VLVLGLAHLLLRLSNLLPVSLELLLSIRCLRLGHVCPLHVRVSQWLLRLSDQWILTIAYEFGLGGRLGLVLEIVGLRGTVRHYFGCVLTGSGLVSIHLRYLCLVRASYDGSGWLSWDDRCRYGHWLLLHGDFLLWWDHRSIPVELTYWWHAGI